MLPPSWLGLFIPSVETILVVAPIALLVGIAAAALASRLRTRGVRTPYTRKVFHFTIFTAASVIQLLAGVTNGAGEFREFIWPVMGLFAAGLAVLLYNLYRTMKKGERWTTTENVLVAGLALAAILYLPALLQFDNYTVSIFYRWWTIHLWVEGVWEMVQAGLLDEPQEGQPTTTVVDAIRADQRLTDDQRTALLAVYRSYVEANRDD